MPTDPSRKFQKELNAGAVSLVLLSLLKEQRVPMYGYEISRLLANRGGEEPPMNQAAIYPVLRSLEKQGLLSSELRPSESGPARRYYRLTPAGRQTQKRWHEIWNSTKHFVDSMLEETDDQHDKRPTRGDHGVPRKPRASAQTNSRRAR